MTGRTSYKTHNYCSTERKWILKTESPGSFCPSCNTRIRKKSRYYYNKYGYGYGYGYSYGYGTYGYGSYGGGYKRSS